MSSRLYVGLARAGIAEFILAKAGTPRTARTSEGKIVPFRGLQTSRDKPHKHS